MSSSKKIFLFSTFITSITLSGSIFYFEYYASHFYHDSDKEIIAQVKNINNISRKKPENHRYWKNISLNDNLHSGETIKTADDSSLEIEFLDNKGWLRLEPDTLLQLRKNKGKFQLALIEGSFESNLNTPIEIKALNDEKPIEISGHAEIKKYPGQKNIQIIGLSDNTLVKKENKPHLLEKNQVVNGNIQPTQLSKKIIMQKPTHLQMIDSEKIKSINASNKVLILNPVVNSSPVNSNSPLATTQIKQILQKSQSVPSVPPALTSIQNSKPSLPPTKKNAERRPAALITSPLQAQKDGSIFIEWKKDSLIRIYKISLLNEGGTAIKNWEQKNNSTTLKKLKPGRYKIKIRGIDVNGKNNMAETEEFIDVPKQNNLQSPKLKGIKVK